MSFLPADAADLLRKELPDCRLVEAMRPLEKLRSIKTALIASVTVLIGMWLERYIIIVPTLSRPRLAAAWGSYSPTCHPTR